jgi:prepilin-type N-terminal cleavage/methylation domain-containing protein
MLSGLRDRLRRQRSEEPDAGMTLIELLVAMTLGTIVAAAALSTFIGTMNSTTHTTNTVINASQARTVLQSWSEMIRLVDSPYGAGTDSGRFGQVGPSTAIFYADIANRTGSTAVGAPTMVQLSLTNGQVVQSLYTATNGSAPYSYPSTPTSTQILMGCPASTTTNGCATPGSVTGLSFTAFYPNAGCATTNLTAADLCTIDPVSTPSLQDAVAVGISITVAPADGGASQSFTTLAAVGTGM